MVLPDPSHAGAGFKPPAIGQGNSSIGGPLFVLNSNSELVTTPHNDPYSVKNGPADASHDNIRPMIVPDMGLYLEIFHAYISTLDLASTSASSESASADDPELTQSPRVQIYGLAPRPQGHPKPTVRLYPHDLDSDFPTIPKDDWWQLLEDPDQTDRWLDLGTEEAIQWRQVVGHDFYLSRRQFVYLAGCREVMCLIERAATIVSGKGMIVGRFVG